MVIMRHGRRVDSDDPTWRYRNPSTAWDPPLSARGLLDLGTIASALGNHLPRPDAIVCSPFTRCLMTARRLIELLGLPHDVPVYVNLQLSEVGGQAGGGRRREEGGRQPGIEYMVAGKAASPGRRHPACDRAGRNGASEAAGRRPYFRAGGPGQPAWGTGCEWSRGDGESASRGRPGRGGSLPRFRLP